MPLTLWIIDKDGVCLDKIDARVGLKTASGVIVRMTDKTIWTARKDGSEWMHRAYDGRLPGVYQSYARKK